MKHQEREFRAWAAHAIHNLKQSATHLLVIDKDWDGELTAADYAFLLQVGHSACVGKPLAIVVPRGHVVPPKLARLADAIEEFEAGDDASLKRATLAVLRKIGVDPKM